MPVAVEVDGSGGGAWQLPPTLSTVAVEDRARLRCRHCLRSPAVDVTPRVTVGIVVAHASEDAPGPYCSTCGTARTRALTNRTLWLGWWSPLSPFAAVRTLWRNASILRRLKRLPAPPEGPLPRYAEEPLEPGRPVLLRSGMLVFAVVAAVLLVALSLISLVSYLGPAQLEGRCVALVDDRRSVRVLDGCGPEADGRIVEIVTGGRRCERPPDVEAPLPEYVNSSRACIELLDR